MNNILELHNIRKTFDRSEHQVDAVKDISLSLRTGEILGIVGESGSGKSTLLRIISGLEQADGGELVLSGQELTRRRKKQELRQIQMIFQDAVRSFHPRKTIASSLRDSIESLTGSCSPSDLIRLTEMVGLSSELLDRYPHQLSGGQAQRFAIARAIAATPDVLLCDEITSALDVSSQAQILDLLDQLNRTQHMSILFVSHDIEAVGAIADRLIVMKDGEIVESGNTMEIMRTPKHEYTRLLLSSVLRLPDQRKICDYWTERAHDFGTVRRNEIADAISDRWLQEILDRLPDKGSSPLKILDVGTGTGYFAVLLARQGHALTGIDLTPAMVQEAKDLMQDQAVNVDFQVMDAQSLEFPDETFDVVISRNLTWTLPDPEAAYGEWIRVLKPGGILLNMDADYARNIRNGLYKNQHRPEGCVYGHCGMTPALEQVNAEITLSMPMASVSRPSWDVDYLKSLGCSATGTDPEIGQRVLRDRDLPDAPMFLIWARK